MKTTSKLMLTKVFLKLLIATGATSIAFAQGELATGQVSGVADGGSFDYTLLLDNTSSSISINGFWYSWTPNIPPYFYLPSVPVSATTPVGWNASIDGNSIEFYANPGVFLAPGQSMNFQYVAAFTPAQLTGATGYSYVYSGGIEGDPGAFINIQTVPAPEPSSLGLFMTGLLGLAGWFKWSAAAQKPQTVPQSIRKQSIG